MRVVYMYDVYYQTYDSTWEAHSAWLWTLVEIHFAIICASAPALKMFFHRTLQPSTVDNYAARQRQGYDHFGSGRQGTNATKDETAISMYDILAYEEANVGAGAVVTTSPNSGNGSKPPAFITVTRGVDVSFSKDGETLSSNAYSQEDALSKKSIRAKASNESLLDNSFSRKQSC